MKKRASSAAVILLLCSLALPASGQQYYLYQPKPVTPEAKGQLKEEDVLVMEVPVNKGDTLYGISRKFSGHGLYYPQILLFNKISDPNLIYTGDTLKIPMPKNDSAVDEVTSEKPVVQKAHKTKIKGREKAARHSASGSAKSSVPSRNATQPSAELSINELNTLAGVKHKQQEKKKRVSGTTIKVDSVHQPEIKPEQLLPVKSTQAEPSQSQGNDGSAAQKLYEKAVKAYKQDDYRTALELFDRYLTDNAGSPLAADASLYKAECYLKLSSQ